MALSFGSLIYFPYLCIVNLKHKVMEILLYIGCATLGTFLGCIIAKGMQSNCKHKWVLFSDRTINNFRNGQEVQVGYVKFYECEHCKKMKREKVELN